jgi:ribosomal protein S18 acetylase RimI-like enzyme
LDEETLLSRVEDAGLNASAPPQQLWMDGWLVRFNAGKAKRARCVNAVAAGRLPLDEKLRLAEDVLAAAGLPLVLRITPFSRPAALDAELEARGLERIDDTRVMVCSQLVGLHARPPAAGLELAPLDGAAFAEAVGALRGSPGDQRAAHAERLASSPVPYSGWVLRRAADGQILACGQTAQEGALVGLYDVYTRDDARGQGLATALCVRLLSEAAKEGAQVAYLQVDAENHAARRIYGQLGFTDRYRYHYRQQPARA